jgi:hypothetical protein
VIALIEFMDSSYSSYTTWSLWSSLGVSAIAVHRAIYLLLQAGNIFALTRPPAILLWTEPDMDLEGQRSEENPDENGAAAVLWTRNGTKPADLSGHLRAESADGRSEPDARPFGGRSD